MKKLILSLAMLSTVFVACSDDDDSTSGDDSNLSEAAVISGGPYTFIAGDGVADIVDDVEVVDAGVGTYNTFVITDAENNVLGLPPTVADFPDFDGAGNGVCLIWHLNYEGDPDTFFEGVENASDLSGDYALSNSLTVNRNGAVAAVLEGGPYNFCVDGVEDRVTSVVIADAGAGSNSSFVITDEDLNILGMPPTLEALSTGPEFDEAGVGVCLIWHLNYEEGALDDLDANSPNAADLTGAYALSNSITVNREDCATSVVAATLEAGASATEGEYVFTVGDGMADSITDLNVVDAGAGMSSTFVVTDEAGNILGLPGMASAPNFDGAGVGICYLRHLNYDGDLTGLTGPDGDGNPTANINDLEGSFKFSNIIFVNRVAAM